MAKGFIYLVAVMDWFSRRGLAWQLSIGMDTDFHVEALQVTTERFGQPEEFKHPLSTQKNHRVNVGTSC
jgi:putative transposase